MYYNEMGELIRDDEIFARMVLDDGREVPYLVSNYGRVWSEKSNKFLANRTFDNGRKLVEIYVDHKRIVLTVARAMALAFLGPCEGMHADHIDNDPTNDILSNIQWLTPQENTRKFCIDRKNNKRYNNKFGEESAHHKYSNETIHNACKLMEQGYDAKYISEETGVAIHTLKKIKSGVSWTNVSYLYDVKNMKNSTRQIVPKEISLFINKKLQEGTQFDTIQQLCLELYDYEISYEILLNRKSRLKREEK